MGPMAWFKGKPSPETMEETMDVPIENSRFSMVYVPEKKPIQDDMEIEVFICF